LPAAAAAERHLPLPIARQQSAGDAIPAIYLVLAVTST